MLESRDCNYDTRRLGRLSIVTIDRWTRSPTWHHAIVNCRMSEDFIEHFFARICHNDYDKLWNQVQKCQQLSPDFIQRYIHLINCEIIMKYQRLPEWLIKELSYNWNDVLQYQILSEPFLEELIKGGRPKIGYTFWRKLFTYQTVSESFIVRYMNEEVINIIFWHQKLSMDFIMQHASSEVMHILAETQILSEAFMDAHVDELDWNDISAYQIMSKEFILRHSERLIMGVVAGRNLISHDEYFGADS